MGDYKHIDYQFFSHDNKTVVDEIGKEALKEDLKKMLLIRNFEIRAESAYQQGKIGGFFHAYIGQEAIQTACLRTFGLDHWYTTTYRCHALAILLGATPNEIMAELYGKVTGNAMGRGGSMHLYTEQMTGGFGIVGGHLPIATGAGFSIKYLDEKNKASICFMGDGSVAQGTFHESLNLAALWNLPCLFVIENNHWGMGTAVDRAISVQPIAEKQAPSYGIKSYTFDGMDYFNCFAGFTHCFEEIKQTSRPILVEVITERFKGHSISDPALYREKEQFHKIMKKQDPILIMKETLKKYDILTEEEYVQMDKEQKDIVVASMKYADESPLPDPSTLEEGVMID